MRNVSRSVIRPIAEGRGATDGAEALDFVLTDTL